MTKYYVLAHCNLSALPLGRGGPVLERGREFYVHDVHEERDDWGRELSRPLTVAAISWSPDGEISEYSWRDSLPVVSESRLTPWDALDMGVTR